MEASAVLGYFDLMTKIADTTGKVLVPNLFWQFLRIVFAIFRPLYEVVMLLFRMGR